ncbi:MAG: Mini-ribonuclease 3 [Clostridiales bacterium]|nr:MAG: Mini-ribonuclease 3 [Clostridiales bacterium]
MKENEALPLTTQAVRQIGAVNLAFIGDAVYDLFIRNVLLLRSPRIKINKLNELKIKCVNATTQAQLAHAVMAQLSDDELAVLKRGRNAKTATVAKNASLVDYKYATGFEALLGHLYLTGQDERLDDILNFALDWCQTHFEEIL